MTGTECEYWYQRPVRVASAVWDRAGRYLVWFDFLALEGLPYPTYTTVGIIDSQKGAERIVTEYAPIGSGIVALSPDGEWAIFERAQGPLSAISLKTQVIIPYPFVEYSPFYGWWVVP